MTDRKQNPSSKKAHQGFYKSFGISEYYKELDFFRHSQSWPERNGIYDELATDATEDMLKCATNLAAGGKLDV